jgi:GTP-binding protein HflX
VVVSLKNISNTEGVKKSILLQLDALIGSKYPHDLLLSPELAVEIAGISAEINREIALYLDRHGIVTDIIIGDRHTVGLPIDMRRRSNTSLSGLRCVHTHPKGSSELSSMDITSMLEGRMDAMLALGLEGNRIKDVHVALPNNDSQYQIYGPLKLDDINNISFLELIREIEKDRDRPTTQVIENEIKNALLIGFKEQKGDLLSGEESIKELKELAHTAGINVHSIIIINNTRPDASHYLRSGKVKEISLYRQQESIDLIIIDDFLSPRQQRNLEDSIGCGVTDRTALILQIFAERARTKEGKLQVELAQLNYLLPRLIGHGQSLSRLGGGIGTKGPGETKLETDRRGIRGRISDLQQEIEVIKRQRATLRKQRQENEIPVVALVGYTNAGKSTLLNTLTQSDVLTENKLFATLDPTTRRLKYKQQEILLTDTVGFIHKLPHQLVTAFRATLEEINYADLLIHVVDAGNPAHVAHIESVHRVLDKIGSSEKLSILVFNKWDTVQDQIELQNTIKINSPSIAISALKGTNIEKLLEMVIDHLPINSQRVLLKIPYSQTSIVNSLYEKAQVINIEYLEDNILCTVLLSSQLLSSLEQFIVDRRELK